MIDGPLSFVEPEDDDAPDPNVFLKAAKNNCRFTSDDEDAKFKRLIAAGMSHVESFTRRQLLTATWDLVLPYFPGRCLELPKPPLQEVVHVKYLDPAGAEQTLAETEYIVTAYAGPQAEPGKLTLGYGKSWPLTLPGHPAAVTVRLKAGYGVEADVAEGLSTAVLVYVTEMFMKPGQDARIVEGAVDGLLWPFRITA